MLNKATRVRPARLQGRGEGVGRRHDGAAHVASHHGAGQAQQGPQAHQELAPAGELRLCFFFY